MCILETPRLLIRELQEQDAEPFYLLNLDPIVIRFTGDIPFQSVGEAKAFINGYSAYKDFGYGRWAVVHRESDKVIGFCGLKYHPESGETDLGYRLMRAYWGQGLATEAAEACLTYGFQQLKLTRIIARCSPQNMRSIRVIDKLGFKFEQEVEEEGEAWLQYAIIAKPLNKP